MSTQLFTPSARVSAAKAAFLDAARVGGLKGLLQAAEREYGGPVLLVDECFRLVASAPAGPTGKPDWDRVQSEHALDREAMFRLLHEELPQQKAIYDPILIQRGLLDGVPMLLGEVSRGNEIRGHLMICLEEGRTREGDLELLGTLLYLLDLQMAPSYRGVEQWNRTMTAQLQLLLAPNTPPHLVDAAVQFLAGNLSGRYAVMVTPIGAQPSQRAFADYAVLHLQQTRRNVAALVHDDAIVTLVGEVKYHPTDPILRPENNRLVGELFRYFERYTLKSGLSNSFQELKRVNTYYRQALLSARLANRINLEVPAVFIDLMPLPLFMAALEAEPERIFLHPVFRQIRAYDREHGTEYERTLRTYELSMRSKEDTADRLSIHKNTLKYRLERIEELFHLPLDDAWTALNLLCTSLLLELSPELGERAAPPAAPGSLLACSGAILNRRIQGASDR